MQRTPGPTSAKAEGARPSPIPEWLWLLTLPIMLAVLFRACRGAPLGVPVADDYAFLYRLAFQHPLDPFDSMGATYYWRPVSRQLYFSLVGGALLTRPWVACGVNAALLLALSALLYRVARRGFAPPVAAAIAAFPLLLEPARALLAWPSGVQHLLAAAAAALALHEALAGRRLTAGASALVGVLSHESAALVLLAFPLAAWFRTRDRREVRSWAAIAGGVAVSWMAGYAVALRHGVVLPPRTGLYPFGRLPHLVSLVFNAALNLEDAVPWVRATVIIGTLAATAIAVFLIARGRRSKAPGPAVWLAAAWFAIGILPLAVLLPDWNAWRALVPTVGLGFAITGLLGVASPWLCAGFVLLRFMALEFSMLAPGAVMPAPMATASQMGFPRIARLQRIVESTRREMTHDLPRLERGTAARYWNMPRLAEVGYMDTLALKVWYRDPTLSWARLGGTPGLKARVDVLVEFGAPEAWPAHVIEPAALRHYLAGAAAIFEDRPAACDSLMVLAGQEHHRNGAFRSVLYRNRGRIAFSMGRYASADSLARLAVATNGNDPEALALMAATAMATRDRERAAAAVQRCLAIDPRHPVALQIATVLGIR
jgi:hypothetical protein